MGIRASCTTTVILKDVEVPADHVLGEVGKGFKIAMRILNSGRTGLGGGCIGAMKKATALASRQAKERKQFGRAIAEFGLVKQKLGQMMIDTYVVEAVVTMVAGIIDAGYDDYAVEAAISKVLASEALWRTIDEALQIAGGNGYMREFPYERMMRDARINRIFEGTNEILRLFIALTGMNDVGQNLKEVAKTIGTVMQDPIKGFGVLSDYARRRVTHATGIGKAQMTKVHPAIKQHSVLFEQLTQNLSSAADRILRKHGKKIIEKQFATKRLADIMIDMYALACVLSRVTSAIQEKGEAGAKQERLILDAFASQVKRRIDANFKMIDDNDDEEIKQLADFAVEKEGYPWDILPA